MESTQETAAVKEVVGGLVGSVDKSSKRSHKKPKPTHRRVVSRVLAFVGLAIYFDVVTKLASVIFGMHVKSLHRLS